MLKYLLGAALGLALYATPASACDGCNKKETVTQADKKDDKGCHCTKDGAKCKCGEKCTCANCKMHEKKDEPKKS
jgi:hypothetical protein